MDYPARRLVSSVLQRQGGACYACGLHIREPEQARLVQQTAAERSAGKLRPVRESVVVHQGCR